MNYQPSFIHEFNVVIKKMLITSFKYPHSQLKEPFFRRKSPQIIERMPVINKQNSVPKPSKVWKKL